MRLSLALVPLAVLLSLPLLAQDPPGEQDGADEPQPGLASLHEQQRERVQKEIEGTWLLMEYRPANALFHPENIRGVAMFRDSYLSINIAAQTFDPEFLGDGRQLYIQGGAHRYRINEFGELQTAAIVAYQNLADEEEVVTEPAGYPREYQVDLSDDGGELTLISPGGGSLRFSRMEPTEFPVESLDALNAARGR